MVGFGIVKRELAQRGGGSSSGGTTGTGGAFGTNQSNGTNGTSNVGSGNGNNPSAQNNNGTGNQKTTDDLQPVWNPETQSYELPNIDVFGDKNLANNNPVSGLGNIGGGTPNVDDLNKDLQNMVNNVNSAQGGNAADNKQEESGGWLNDLWNKGKEEAKKKAEEEAKKALEKAKQEALNAAKDTVSGVGILDKTGLDDKINAEIDKAGNKVNTDNWVDGAKDKFGWNEETSERNGEDNIGGALDAGKIPGTEGSTPDIDALNKDLQNMVNGTGNALASDYGWNEETSERNGYDAEPSGADIQPVWDHETQSYVLPEVEVVGDAGAGRKPLPGAQGSTPDIDALNKDLQNMVNGTGNASASDYGWNEETSERNGYDAEPSGADIQPVWDPETQSYVLPEVEVVGDAGASHRPLPGTQGSTPDVDALNKDLQNMVNGTGNASASDYGWNEETSERNGYNADGTQGSSSNSDYGWNEETSEGRGWGG